MKKNVSQSLLDSLSSVSNTLDDLANESLTISRPLYRLADIFVSLVYYPLKVVFHSPSLTSSAQFFHTTEGKFARSCIIGVIQKFFDDFSIIQNPEKYFSADQMPTGYRMK